MNKIETLKFIAATTITTIVGISSIVRIRKLHHAAMHRNDELLKTFQENHPTIAIDLADMKTKSDDESI